MGRHLLTALATCSIFLGLGATAAAQSTNAGAKAVTATGSTASGLSVRLSAAVAGGTTAGEGCVSVTGHLKRSEVSEGGCGPLTVEVDDLLNSGRVRGAVGGVTVDVSVSGSGLATPVEPKVAFPSYPSCNGFFPYGYGCWLGLAWQAVVQNIPSVLIKRDGPANGVLTGSSFATTRLSGTGTLYLVPTRDPRG